jgi:hypothetical protein
VVRRCSTRPPALGQATALVLGDFHVITAAPVHQDLTLLFEHQPVALRLVLATCADPPLPLARLRASGQFEESRADDLRVTADEAAAFLGQTMGLEPPSARTHRPGPVAPGAAKAYLRLLGGGSSGYPLELLRAAGVDLGGPEPVEAALRVLSEMVDRLATLTAGGSG